MFSADEIETRYDDNINEAEVEYLKNIHIKGKLHSSSIYKKRLKKENERYKRLYYRYLNHKIKCGKVDMQHQSDIYTSTFYINGSKNNAIALQNKLISWIRYYVTRFQVQYGVYSLRMHTIFVHCLERWHLQYPILLMHRCRDQTIVIIKNKLESIGVFLNNILNGGFEEIKIYGAYALNFLNKLHNFEKTCVSILEKYRKKIIQKGTNSKDMKYNDEDSN